MLDASISEFFLERYFAAANAAGVAQEIYGKKLRIYGIADKISELIKAANVLVADSGGPVVETKEWKKIAGRVKNGIKHFDSESDQYIDVDAEEEARHMINDAICEHDKLRRATSLQIERFNSWAREYALKAINAPTE